jgi:hypothetical protein
MDETWNQETESPVTSRSTNANGLGPWRNQPWLFVLSRGQMAPTRGTDDDCDPSVECNPSGLPEMTPSRALSRLSTSLGWPFTRLYTVIYGYRLP